MSFEFLNRFSKASGQSTGSNFDFLKNKLTQRQAESDKPKPKNYMPESTVPFGAKSVTKDGMAYYGEGVHGWIRKTYGDLFDPSKRLVNPDEADWEQYQGYANKFAQKLSGNDAWNQWGEKIFGLSTKEAGNALAAIFAPGAIHKENLQEQVEAGEISKSDAFWEQQGAAVANAANMTKDAVQRSFWGALEIIGLTDVGMRKIWATRIGLDEMADKFGKPDEGGFWSQLNSIGYVKDAYTVTKATLEGKTTIGEVKENLEKYMIGSNAIYTIASDEAVRDEFERRVANGEDAGFVAAEVGRPGIEFAGSILGDPATYLGLGIVKPSLTGTAMKIFGREIKVFGVTQRVPWQKIGRIPTLGELVGLKVGMARMADAAENHFFKYANEELGRLTQKMFDAKSSDEVMALADDKEILRLLDTGRDKVIRPADVALEQGKKITATGIGDLESTSDVVRKAALKNQYNVTSYTSKAKAALLGRNTSLVMDMIMGSSRNVDDAMDTIGDMVKMQNGTDAERVLAAKRLMLKGVHNADGTVTGHGALLFSEAGMMTGDILARMEPKVIDDLFTQFGDKPHEFVAALFNTLEGAFQKAYPSVDEMSDAAKAVRSGKFTPEEKILAQKFSELPAHVKATNAINRQLQKIQGPVVGMQVNLFMKWSPGYAARNIFGQGLGIALDMGLGRAIDMSANAAWRPFVGMVSESLGKTEKIDPYLKQMIFRQQQVIDATGAAPHAMLEAVGMSNVRDAKGFNALTFAQRGEKLTSAEIVAETIFDELDKALPAVLSGDASVQTALVDTGILNDKQARLFLKELTENHGNADKAIETLRKSISDKKVETWRHLPMPKNMRNFLRKTGNLGEVQKLQQEAKTLDEFTEGVNKILSDMYEAVKKNASNEVPSIDSEARAMVGNLSDDIIDNFNGGLADELEADLVNRKIQAWQNVRSYLEETSTRIRDELVVMSEKLGVNASPFKDKITAANKLFNRTYTAVNDVRDMTRRVVEELRVGSITPEEAFNRLRHSDGYDIRAMFESVDPSKLSNRQATEYVWSGYFQFGSDHWRNSNNAYYENTMNTLMEWAETNGSSLDDIAALHNLPNDPLVMLQKAYKEANDLEKFGTPSISKFSEVPAGTTLNDMTQVSDMVDASGKPFSKRRIFNTVNAERKAQGLKPYATHADVPWQEAQQMMNSRMSNFASPAEVVKAVNKKMPKPKKIKLGEDTPLDELPAPVLEKVQLLAKKMLDELSGGQVEKLSSGMRVGSTNIKWWQDASKAGNRRNLIEKALEKIAGGSDANTANVKRVKEMIFDTFRHGDAATGTPPDMYALQQLGADNKTLKAALDDFNEITKNKFSLDEAVEASTPADELLRAGDQPYYDDAGNLVQPQRYARVQDIPEELIRDAVDVNKLPPPLNQEVITPARGYWENMDGFIEEAGKWKDEVVQNWGKMDEAGDLPDNMEEAVSTWKKTFDERIRHVRDRALVMGSDRRDFLLHDYNKTYADTALAYLMPFSYWHTRTYARWAERVIDQPKWANMYMAYKRKQEIEHAEDPEWWRQNIGIKVPGINNGNPIFMNLEATLNPLNGLTGVDFNDPYKRVDWLSRTVDDMGKMGPAFTSPLNWAVSAWLYAKGEEEASKRWLGRLFPQTTQIKGLLTKAGADVNFGRFIQHNEIDPFINMQSDGLDPYELNRVNRHLAAIVENEQDPELRALLATQAVDAARTHSGDLWDQARTNAINERAGGQIASYLLGVGFKPRTEEDKKVDQFYGEYFKLIQLRDRMSTEEYRQSWDSLRDRYPFADALIIGKKADPERDAAFSYNVLGRIPPGQMGDLFSLVGLSNDDINRFYESKGDFSTWTEGDQKRFMAAVVDLSAVLQMPPSATRQEWRDVKTNYGDMKDMIADELGGDIWDLVDQYFALKNESRYKGNAFLHDHPEINRALDMQTQITASSPGLFKYYGSINTLQSYYNGEVRRELEAKYGNDIYDRYYAYLDELDPAKKKQMKTPDLKAFMDEKGKKKDPINRAIVEMMNKLPNRPEYAQRADLTDPSAAQQSIINTLNAGTSVDPQMLWANTSPALQELVGNYWMNGGELSYAARGNLDFVAEQFGISGDEALQLMGVMITQQ